jgi:uncharacterized membrane protein
MAADWTWAWWWPIGWIFFIFLMVMIMRFVFWGRRGWRHAYWGPHGYYGPPGHVPAEEILRQRLAKGEITEDEYKRLMDVLSR